MNPSQFRIASTEAKNTPDLIDLQILATSDLHGKFFTWDYAQNVESKSGSLTQLYSAVKERRNDNTLVLDAGDTIQDNNIDIFLDSEEVFPMIAAMNAIGYDAWVTGNHEYNFGLEALRKIISQQKAAVLVGNVWDAEGNPLGRPYAIFERAGLKIGVIGMVTPNILRWDSINLSGCTVTDPVVEARKAIDEIKDAVDVLIGLVHMGIHNEYDLPNTGVIDLANACPEFSLIIAAHGHHLIEGMDINGVLVIENKNMAQTMNEVHLFVEKTEDGCKVVNRTSKAVQIKSYEPDPTLAELLRPYNDAAVAFCETKIGELKGGALAPENEMPGVPIAQMQDTAMMELVNTVMMYYTDAKVSAVAVTNHSSPLQEGDIRLCDVSQIYKFSNTLYKLHMTGSQLKIYMEWSAGYYQTFRDGDLTIAFDPDVRSYNYDLFAGVNFDIDISKPFGERIVNLTWPDGTAVDPAEEFDIAVNNYRATSHLLVPGAFFEEDDMPKLVEMDVHGSDIGDLRALIIDYIMHVKGGIITPECDNNWRIIGNNWDAALHAKAVRQVNDGLIVIPTSKDGRTPNVAAVTVNDLK